MEVGIEAKDGLLSWPYTQHDWAIVLLALCGFLYRMYLMYKTTDVKNPTARDWGGMFVLTAIATVTLYEFALSRGMELRSFYPIFAIAIVLVRDVTDWLFMSKDGRDFVINTFKEMAAAILGKFGYEKKD